MGRLGLGVLGLGEGRSIISAGVTSDLWDVVMLCDLNEDLRRARSAEFGVGAHTGDLAELLANPAVDAVGIYTPDHLHADHVIAALEAGKHVIVTKPFLNDLSQAAEVLAAQRAAQKVVFVGQSTRFFASFQRQREHYETGELGELSTIEAVYSADHRWFLDKPWARQASFKWLFGGVSHPADLVRWYLPEIESVMGYSHLSANGRAGGLVNDDTFHFVLKARDGRIARVSASYSLPTVPSARDSDMTCILRCTDGASQADYHELRYSWKIGDRSVVELLDGEDEYYFRFGGHSHHAGEYQNYIDHVARSIAAGTTPYPDVREGVGTVALLVAMEEACATGGPVRVADVLQRHGLGELE